MPYFSSCILQELFYTNADSWFLQRSDNQPRNHKQNKGLQLVLCVDFLIQIEITVCIDHRILFLAEFYRFRLWREPLLLSRFLSMIHMVLPIHKFIDSQKAVGVACRQDLFVRSNWLIKLKLFAFVKSCVCFDYRVIHLEIWIKHWCARPESNRQPSDP